LASKSLEANFYGLGLGLVLGTYGLGLEDPGFGLGLSLEILALTTSLVFMWYLCGISG